MACVATLSRGSGRIVVVHQQLAVFADILLKLLPDVGEGTADLATPTALLTQILPCYFSAWVCR
jgi:hypothetical protein